jgi:hypothetical protein
MKKLKSSYEKNVGATSKTVTTAALLMLVSIIMVSLYSASNITIPDTASQLVVAVVPSIQNQKLFKQMGGFDAAMDFINLDSTRNTGVFSIRRD